MSNAHILSAGTSAAWPSAGARALSTAYGLRDRLEGGQSHQVEGERRPGRRQLDPVDHEVALPSRLPVRRHGLGIPGQHHLVVRFLPHVRDYVYTDDHDAQAD